MKWNAGVVLGMSLLLSARVGAQPPYNGTSLRSTLAHALSALPAAPEPK